MSLKTLLKSCTLSGLMLATLAAACPGQVTLKHKFHEGSSQIVETTARIKQSLTINGMAVDTASDVRSAAKTSVGGATWKGSCA